MKRYFKRLDSSGFSHDILAVLFVVVFAIGGVAYLVGSHADNLPANNTSANASNANFASYTKIGTISAKKLYDVKVPPPTTEQPSMAIYACYVNGGNDSGYVVFVAELSKAIPGSISSSWYDNLDLSSSPTADNVISTKSGTLSYSNNSWVSNSKSLAKQSTVISTAPINPGAVTDYYIWANGSYQNVIYNVLSSHPNVTNLATCSKP